MRFIGLSKIFVRNYLAKIHNLPNHHTQGPLRRGAQCRRIGLRPALPVIHRYRDFVNLLKYDAM